MRRGLICEHLFRDLPGEVIVRNLVLQEVRLKVILDRATGMFRMALVRRDHSACVTLECKFSDLSVMIRLVGTHTVFREFPALSIPIPWALLYH